MLYLWNINQTWHGVMVRYLEDAYVTGNVIHPTSLPDAYHFLDNWKTCHQIRGASGGRGEGVLLVNKEGQEQTVKSDLCYVVPGREHMLCWDCGYYGHRQGNRVCPNYDPSKRNESHRSNNNSKQGEQVNETKGGGQLAWSASKEETGRQESSIWTAPVAVVAKSELISCTLMGPDVEHKFTF